MSDKNEFLKQKTSLNKHLRCGNIQHCYGSFART